ncbi:MAG: GntR family transcriptional regulator [Spirochaetaceae bacterium]|nr:MAG: GntR family transcriptional regulator [Spirochaetaceae bacterium]
MAKIKRENLSSKVYAVLKQMIANSRFKPGARINVEKITKELGVSRTPVWEAIRRLEQEGLVMNSPNKGVFMNTLTPEEALDLYAVREVLEGMAARLAAEKIDEKVLAKLEKSLQKQKKIIANEDLVAYSQEDFDFHALIYEASGNPVLRELLQNIKNKMRPISMHVGGFLRTFYEDHTLLVQALEMRDPENAEMAFRKHNQNVMRIIRDEVKSFV